MAKFSDQSSHGSEVVTEILDEDLWWRALDTVIVFLQNRKVTDVDVEFGFLVERDLKGLPQPAETNVPLENFRDFVRRGFDEGTIEWNRSSDFIFKPKGLAVKFTLCNDADLHVMSDDGELLSQVVADLKRVGVKFPGSI